MLVQRQPIPQRVLDRVWDGTIMGWGGCIIATSAPTAEGYTRVGWYENGKIYRTMRHRAAWIAVHGPIPDGFTPHHRCFTPPCANVDHLELKSWSHNSQIQGALRGRTALDRCGHGHGPEHWSADRGYYGCRECRREAHRRWYWERAGREQRVAYNRAYHQAHRPAQC